MLTSEPPPSYTEVTSSGYGPGSRVSGSHHQYQVVVTTQEVEEVLRRHAQHVNLTINQKETIKRKTESLLKRHLQEHGILPSSQQKRFILERVVSEFVPQSNNVHLQPPRPTSSSGHNTPHSTSSNSARTTVLIMNSHTPPNAAHPSPGGQMDNQRVVIGKWWCNSNVYSDELQQVVRGMIVITLIICLIGTPLTLFFTVPTLHILRKVSKVCIFP